LFGAIVRKTKGKSAMATTNQMVSMIKQILAGDDNPQPPMARKPARSIGPIQVNRDGRLIGHLYQNPATRVWTAYNKVKGAPFWTKRHGTKGECVAWLEAVAVNPDLLKRYDSAPAFPIQ
jgi:hypothetical protein